MAISSSIRVMQERVHALVRGQNRLLAVTHLSANHKEGLARDLGSLSSCFAGMNKRLSKAKAAMATNQADTSTVSQVSLSTFDIVEYDNHMVGYCRTLALE